MKIKVLIAKVMVAILITSLFDMPVYAYQASSVYRDYKSVIRKTADMVGDREAQRIAKKYGLDILNVTWEDTGRYKNSSVGPNISDMTIQVQQKDPKTGEYHLTCMPVIRYPNFSDKTGDVDMDKFYLLVGNEKGKDLKKMTLREFLGNLRKNLSDPHSWNGKETSLLADRDTHALVSAQACFLPIPKAGIAEFNPVIFNYQSYEGDPAVLTILATREGTSVTVIDNKKDGFEAGYSWGQRLFFNKDGQRCSLTGQRLSDFIADDNNGYSINSSSKEKEGLNMVLLIQVPLKQKKPKRYEGWFACDSVGIPQSSAVLCEKLTRSNVENAVIGHGKVEGPFTEIDDLAIERDPKYPIRVTVQFYKATSNGVVNEQDIKEVADQIDRVYNQADYVGSLVVGGDTNRPTEYIGDKNEPSNWWHKFWRSHEKNTCRCKHNARCMFNRPSCIKEPQPKHEWGILDETKTE